MTQTNDNDAIVPTDRRKLSPWLGDEPFEACKNRFDRDGYIVFERVLSESQIKQYRDALQPHLIHQGRNNFEGHRTNRVYALLAKEPDVMSAMAAHPLALAFAEAELGASCLLSALLAINLHPGETVQPWHHDDSQIEVPLPRPAFGVSAFWAIDPMTEDNGATEIIPGSHLWGQDQAIAPPIKDQLAKGLTADHDPQPRGDAKRMTMPAGSLMLTKGTLWHRGGANRSQSSRLIITPQYCPGWARQIENMMAAVPPPKAMALPLRVRQLLGYSLHSAFMGYVDGIHPDRAVQALQQREQPGAY